MSKEELQEEIHQLIQESLAGIKDDLEKLKTDLDTFREEYQYHYHDTEEIQMSGPK